MAERDASRGSREMRERPMPETAVHIDPNTLQAIIAGVTAQMRKDGTSKQAEERGGGSDD